jgi:hypothetical protein
MMLQPPGSLDPFAGFVLAMVAFNLLWYATIRLLQNSDVSGVASGGEASTADVTRADSDTVRCPDCETVNERDYRYCRSCVSTLPNGGGVDQFDTPSFGRIVR